MKADFGVVALAFAAFLIGSCASRSVPSSFPATSAASLKAQVPRPEPATRALAEDPPLPGENTERWPGLRPSDGSTKRGHMHDHHHGWQP